MALYVHDVSWLYREDVFSSMLPHVDEKRRAKAQAYHFMKDRALSLGAGLLLHYALKGWGTGEPLPSDFHFNDFGKPALAGGPNFNLSHSGTYVACALDDGPVGVDIERVEVREERLARRCFLDRELQEVMAGDRVDEDAFCAYWVLKESYIKFLGAGLSIDPLRIQIRKGEGFRLDLDGLEQALSLRLYQTLPGYQLALCQEAKRPCQKLEVVSEESLRAKLSPPLPLP